MNEIFYNSFDARNDSDQIINWFSYGVFVNVCV